jgi:hypothetical protein
VKVIAHSLAFYVLTINLGLALVIACSQIPAGSVCVRKDEAPALLTRDAGVDAPAESGE